MEIPQNDWTEERIRLKDGFEESEGCKDGKTNDREARWTTQREHNAYEVIVK